MVQGAWTATLLHLTSGRDDLGCALIYGKQQVYHFPCVDVGGVSGRHWDHVSQCQEHSIAVNAVEDVSLIERKGGAALLEPKGGCEHHDFHSTEDRHPVVALSPK